MQCQVRKSHDMMTHLWKQTSVFHIGMLESLCDTFTFTEWENFLRFLSLDNPCIWTLSQTTEVPGFEPGEPVTGKPWNSCSLVDSATTVKPKRSKQSITIHLFTQNQDHPSQPPNVPNRTLTPPRRFTLNCQRETHRQWKEGRTP